MGQLGNQSWSTWLPISCRILVSATMPKVIESNPVRDIRGNRLLRGDSLIRGEFYLSFEEAHKYIIMNDLATLERQRWKTSRQSSKKAKQWEEDSGYGDRKRNPGLNDPKAWT